MRMLSTRDQRARAGPERDNTPRVGGSRLPAPPMFHVSSTALSLGTTLQTWLSDRIALQGTGMLGVG